jgi:LytS/YehU family sensor histidine kinase
MEHDVVAVIIFFLMIGMNLGVKYYFRQSQDRERLEKLERENLEQQLEYLKYQINPHFLMNTLNNIHALVDIDSEQAKETIVELSKIMRFVLYEGSKQKVSLRREMIFLDNYIQLMRLRVAEQVDISVDIPQVIPDKDIPPLMMITFVENAFKHGVSYQQHSFIDISIQIADDQLHFHCRNSKVPQGEDRHGGVGLQNVKKRLQLIYGSTYTLDIKDESETYTVDLTLPL